MQEIRRVALPDGTQVPVLGQGTWRMGEERAQRGREVAALRHGLDLGITLIDTAEMYGEGEAEAVVGEAIAGRRGEVYLVSKVYPHNASRTGVRQACERSLRRLKSERIDLYLLHWRGSHPLAETVAGFEDLREAGMIGAWGVSNFDVDDMEELFEAGGGACATNQILFNVDERGPEYDLLPWLHERGIPAMAYSPLGQGSVPRHKLDDIARKHGVSVFQIALAFAILRSGGVAIPKASDPGHVEENRAACDVELDDDDLRLIDERFPPPRRKKPLAMI